MKTWIRFGVPMMLTLVSIACTAGGLTEEEVDSPAAPRRWLGPSPRFQQRRQTFQLLSLLEWKRPWQFHQLQLRIYRLLSPLR